MAKINIGKIMLTVQGEYSSTTTYSILDVVICNGNTYISKVDDNVGNEVTDTEKWQLLVEKSNNATINGYNTVLIDAGNNINITQADGVLTISAVIPDKTSDLTNDSNFAKTNENNNFSSAQTINGNLTINGNITQNGESYVTHAEQVNTKNDKILLREGATGGLGANEFTGIEAEKYDGTNNGLLVFGTDGTARVGDQGDTQPLATRKETANMTNGEIVVWNAETMQFETGSTNDKVRSVNPITANSLPANNILVPKTEYYLVELVTLTMAYPTNANLGDYCYVKFRSGATPTTLTITETNVVGDTGIVTKANKTYEIMAFYNGTDWCQQYICY